MVIADGAVANIGGDPMGRFRGLRVGSALIVSVCLVASSLASEAEAHTLTNSTFNTALFETYGYGWVCGNVTAQFTHNSSNRTATASVDLSSGASSACGTPAVWPCSFSISAQLTRNGSIVDTNTDYDINDFGEVASVGYGSAAAGDYVAYAHAVVSWGNTCTNYYRGGKWTIEHQL